MLRGSRTQAVNPIHMIQGIPLNLMQSCTLLTHNNPQMIMTVITVNTKKKHAICDLITFIM